MAFFTTTSSDPGTTILVAQTWHRVTAGDATAAGAMTSTVE
jgi:hypothetical protein